MRGGRPPRTGTPQSQRPRRLFRSPKINLSFSPIMTCNSTMSAFGIIQPETRKKIYFFFGPDDLLYSNMRHREIASRHGEESFRSASFSFCKSVLEERFAHKREIWVFKKPLKRGLCSRPFLIKTRSLGAFGRTSAFCTPRAYFNRRPARRRGNGVLVRKLLSGRKLRRIKDSFLGRFDWI